MNAPEKESAPTNGLRAEYQLRDFGQVSTEKLIAYQYALSEVFRFSEQSFWNIAEILSRIDVEILRRQS